MSLNFKLTSFSVNNFRVFEKTNKFDIAPITVLTGMNSSGKSSVTKALALLVDSYNQKGLHSLNLLSSNLNISSFNAFKNNKSKEKLVKFEVCFIIDNDTFLLKLAFDAERMSSFEIFKNDSLLLAKSPTTSYIRLPANFVDREKVSEMFFASTDAEIDEICQKIIDYLSSDNSSHRHSGSIFSGWELKHDFATAHEIDVKYALQSLDDMTSGSFYDHETKSEKEYSVFTGSNPRISDVIPKLALAYGVASNYLSSLLNLKALNESKILKEGILRNFFNSFHFISAIRSSQEIIFTSKNSPLFYNILADFLEFGDNMRAFNMLDKWIIKEFKLIKVKQHKTIDDFFKIETIEGVGFLVRFYNNGVWQELASLGYGVTQLIPIILQVATKRGGSFIIEEPESNLHPALQSKLADFFLNIIKPTDIIDKVLQQVQSKLFIIETHSEYFIRKLQYLTASNSGLESNDTVIYYFYPPDEIPAKEDQVKRILIKENGSLSDDFGQGFIDEASSWKFELLKINNAQNN